MSLDSFKIIGNAEAGVKDFTIDFNTRNPIILTDCTDSSRDKGLTPLQVLYTLEALLGEDYSSSIITLDQAYEYKKLNYESVLSFTNDCTITGKEGRAIVRGTYPKTHVIRTVMGGRFRSFICTTNREHYMLASDMRKFTPNIPITTYREIADMVNTIVKDDTVSILQESRKINFEYDKLSPFSKDAVDFIYLLVAECFLTPTGYKRVLLLSEMDLLTKHQRMDVIRALSKIRGTDSVIAISSLPVSELMQYSNIKLVEC